MIAVRPARLDDVGTLQLLINRSVRGLQYNDYTAAEIDRALAAVYGVDTQLILDGTYYVAEELATRDDGAATSPDAADAVVVGCGGWSKRRTLFGGDHFVGREDAALDPARDAAKIRAFFVDPAWARRGIGSLILEACERAAVDAGFTRLENGRDTYRCAILPGTRVRGIRPTRRPLARRWVARDRPDGEAG